MPIFIPYIHQKINDKKDTTIPLYIEDTLPFIQEKYDDSTKTEEDNVIIIELF